MMNRRTFVASVAGALAAPFTGEAQQAGKTWRIGNVLVGTLETIGHLDRTIEASLAKAGYVSGLVSALGT